VPESDPLPPQYDRIAHLYDVDMARNMPFDDVGFYARICALHGGRVLEIGCGSGRILLALQAGGIDAVGVDGSAKMLGELAAKAAAAGVPLRACRMDARRLAFGARFDVVLCPYSLVTYMSADRDAARLLEECRRVLTSTGIVVVDAFVPRQIAQPGTFTRDYARPFGTGVLIRSKRVTSLSPRINRIERRYEVLGADGGVQDIIETSEDIRLFRPEELLALLAECRFRPRETWWNYVATVAPPDPQFFTVIADLRT
jgi:ubiquinone/menaquinone biosynthesis C-methylase UbiE